MLTTHWKWMGSNVLLSSDVCRSFQVILYLEYGFISLQNLYVEIWEVFFSETKDTLKFLLRDEILFVDSRIFPFIDNLH